MSGWRWTCSERGACSFIVPRPYDALSLGAEETFFLPVYTFLWGFFSSPTFCCNRSTTNLFMISFLSSTPDFFFFFLSLWNYLRLAETSQQPISQTTWLKVTPHWNPLYLYYDFSFSILFLFYIHLFRVSFSSCWDALWGIYSDVTLPYLTLAPVSFMNQPDIFGVASFVAKCLALFPWFF